MGLRPHLARSARGRRPAPASLHGIRQGSKMEGLDLQSGGKRGAAALGFGTADAFGGANHLDVARGQQRKDALVETKIAHRILYFAVFDIPKSVTGKTGEKRGPWINTADVPKTAYQQ